MAEIALNLIAFDKFVACRRAELLDDWLEEEATDDDHLAD
jgi:hypothetical protein